MSEFLDRIADIEWTTIIPPGGPSSLEEVEELREQAARRARVEAETAFPLLDGLFDETG